MRARRTMLAGLALAVMLAHGLPADAQTAAPSDAAAGRRYLGFDRNDYPGDAALPALRKSFDFVGYWLNTPPGADENNWLGHRHTLVKQGFGFLVLANGRMDKQIKAAQASLTHMTPAQLGVEDAEVIVAVARGEGFPANTILFLDQEEGGRLLPEQAAYLLAWTEAVAKSGYRAGVYASGQPNNEGHGIVITTAQDIRARVKAGHLHEVALWIAQDSCPPSPGCQMKQVPPVDQSGTPGAVAWQYAQSPRRKSVTNACAATYTADNNCRVPTANNLDVDLNVANSADPSHGR